MSSGYAPTVRVAARGKGLWTGVRGQARRLSSNATALAITVASILGLILRLYMLARPNYLLGVTGYDDGVDFGAALRLIDGALPYRDFAFVQPPGIAVLLAPVAALAKLTGSTDAGLAVARLLTALVGAANVTLVGLLVRHRGAVAAGVACGLFAVSPDAILASHSVLLEPWLVLFVLAGALLLFDRDQLTTSSGRVVIGGGLLGFACAIKVWAVIPVAVLTICFVAGGVGRRSTLRFIAGVLGGAAVFTVPFAALGPNAFLRDVVFAQLARGDVTRVPLIARLVSFTGLRDLQPAPGVTIAVASAMFGAVALYVTVPWVHARLRRATLDWFVMVTAAAVAAAFLWPADYYSHYDAFLEPFLVCALALPLAALAAFVVAPGATANVVPSPLPAARPAPGAARVRAGEVTAELGAIAAAARWPVLVFLSTRAALLAMAAIEHVVRHQPFLAQLATWDGKWYGQLALNGYPTQASLQHTTLGFFPLYPIVVRRVAGVLAHLETPLPFTAQINLAGVIVSGFGGALATVLVQRLAASWWGERSGRRAAVLFCVFPGSVVFSMVYAEGLLIPLAAGCILALGRRRWLLAGCLAGLATATAPQGLVLILVCACAAARELLRSDQGGRRAWRSLWAPALSLTGVGAFACFLWIRTGTPLASLHSQQSAWHERTNPFAVVDLVSGAVAQITHPLANKSTYKPVVAAIGVPLLLVLLAVLFRRRRTVSLEALVWTGGVSFLALTTEYLPPNPRMLITAFPALIAPASCVKGRWFVLLAAASFVLLLGASWLTFTVGHRMLPP
jgi:Mannosyltransferase (PIG-V)